MRHGGEAGAGPAFVYSHYCSFVQELERLGATVELRELGTEPGTNPPLQLPPVILAQLGNDPAKKTVKHVDAL